MVAAQKESFCLRKLFAPVCVCVCVCVVGAGAVVLWADLTLPPSSSPQRHLEEASHPKQDQCCR